MENDKISKGAENDLVLSRFLRRPEDQAAFMAFYRMCQRLTLGRLIDLEHRGYRLPVGPHNSYADKTDLTIDILGTFLRYEKGVRFGVVLNYFAEERESEFETISEADLMFKFRGLLLGYVRQELYRITQQEYPEAADLKKRLKAIFAGEKYTAVSLNGYSDLICLSGNSEIASANKSLIPQNALECLAEEAYLKTKNFEAWCAEIFSMLGQCDTYLQAIPRYQLLAAAVKISGTYLEVDAMPPAALPTPTQLALAAELERLRAEVVDIVRKEVISRFVGKGKISIEAGKNFRRAVMLFLEDKSNGNQTDVWPAYFREVMPGAEHDGYLKNYKYVFETIISRAEEEFEERVKKSSTIRRLWNYHDNEEDQRT